MNTHFAVYISSGEISRYGICAETDVSLQVQTGEFVMEGEGQDDTHWVDTTGPTIMAKTELSLTPDKSSITADGVDAATIAVPAGVTVSLNGGEPVEVTDGEVVFKTLDKGEHKLVFTGIKYLPKEVTIGAV